MPKVVNDDIESLDKNTLWISGGGQRKLSKTLKIDENLAKTSVKTQKSILEGSFLRRDVP